MSNLTLLETLDITPELKEVFTVISGLKNTKSPGPDGLPVEILKRGAKLPSKSLYIQYELMCQIWTDGKVPKILKDANIVTIFKKKKNVIKLYVATVEVYLSYQYSWENTGENHVLTPSHTTN